MFSSGTLTTLRRSLLTTATAAALCITAAGTGHTAVAATTSAPATTTPLAAPLAASPGAPGAAPSPYDRAERLAEAPAPSAQRIPGPDSSTGGRVPGARTPEADAGGKADASTTGKTTPKAAATVYGTAEGAAVPCTLDGVTGLSPDGLTAFLADPEVTADDCLRSLIWTWDERLAPVMSAAHIQAVSRRITALSPGHDGHNGTRLREMFTYLHAISYHGFSHDEVDLEDPDSLAAMRQAVDAFASAARTFDATDSNADTLREALLAASAQGLRQYQLPLVKRVLSTMDADHPATATDTSWGGAALAALSLNYLGVYPGNQDRAFRSAVEADPSYRAAFEAFAGYTHLKDTANAWTVRDAVNEYGRFGQIGGLRHETVTSLGALLDVTARNFGAYSAPWAKAATWLIEFNACAPHQVCRDDIEKGLFPQTYTYGRDGTDGITVRTGLDHDTVDQLYYASQQVKAQFHRVLGTEEPLAGDPNSTLHVVLYKSRADYENFQPLLTGLGTNNGGMYIEKGATFYTYQRRVPQDSSLTLEELFRHEYTHYLNGRWAVPGFFGEGPWYEGDRTTAMDEGTAEFFDGATRDEGIKVRKSLVRGIIADTANGGPRMTVDELLHATYAGDGFRFYNYAGTFFEFLWTEHPALLQEMYRHLRADDPGAFDAWRDRLGGDAGLQTAYDAFLDEQIAHADELFVPDTRYVPLGELRDTTPEQIRASFTSSTYLRPECEATGSADRPRFSCTGRITARLSDSGDADAVFEDMSETVDYFILDRAAGGDNNLADMNCSFGAVDIWSDGRGGTSDFTCEGPLRG
ncbi:collagenase [Streptomyces sp. KLOTTS4A1]|uniref:collagenase n=1 Tax=Streptomyces sp. KLOTTS4A1 TaxID=3390996 RepID=UPI0039F45CCD